MSLNFIPKILSKVSTRLSPWVGVIEKKIQFQENSDAEIYHSFELCDYITIIATNKEGLIPIVRQYRPAIEDYIWEFPAGLFDNKKESLQDACCRELLEETGLIADSVKYLGEFYTDTGRMENRLHVFAVKCSRIVDNFKEESGMLVKYVTLPELKDLIKNKEFRFQLHIGALFLYEQNLE